MKFNEAISKSVQDRQKEQVNQSRQQRQDMKSKARDTAQQNVSTNIQNQKDFQNMKNLQKQNQGNNKPNDVGELEQVSKPGENLNKKEKKYERPANTGTGTSRSKGST